MSVPPISVNYQNVRQENEFWCWAAVAANVFNSFLPPGEPFSPGRRLHQCDVAEKAGQNCSFPNTSSLRNALASPRHGLGIWDGENDQPAYFLNVIRDELKGSPDWLPEPVCSEAHFDSLTHFVAITGLDPATSNVWVADPFPGGDSVEFTLDAFLNSYYFYSPDGTVAEYNGVITTLQAVKFLTRPG